MPRAIRITEARLRQRQSVRMSKAFRQRHGLSATIKVLVPEQSIVAEAFLQLTGRQALVH